MRIIFYIVDFIVVILWCSILFYMYTHWNNMTTYEKIFLTLIEVILTPGLTGLPYLRK